MGIYHGSSIKSWREYFSKAKIYTADVDEETFLTISDLDVEYFYCNQDNPQSIQNMWKNDSLNDIEFDVIIDDGSHLFNDQVKSFGILKNKMKSDGIYIIEDVNDIDSKKQNFINLHPNSEIIDNRHIKNRSDDVLILYKF